VKKLKSRKTERLKDGGQKAGREEMRWGWAEFSWMARGGGGTLIAIAAGLDARGAA
jgi:hypothetical protein